MFVFNDSSIIPELVLTKKPFPNSYIYLVFFIPTRLYICEYRL